MSRRCPGQFSPQLGGAASEDLHASKVVDIDRNHRRGPGLAFRSASETTLGHKQRFSEEQGAVLKRSLASLTTAKEHCAELPEFIQDLGCLGIECRRLVNGSLSHSQSQKRLAQQPHAFTPQLSSATSLPCKYRPSPWGLAPPAKPLAAKREAKPSLMDKLDVVNINARRLALAYSSNASKPRRHPKHGLAKAVANFVGVPTESSTCSTVEEENSSLVEEESSSLLEIAGSQQECQDELLQVSDCIQVNKCMQESTAPILNPTLLTSHKVCQGKRTSKSTVPPEKALAPKQMYNSTERREFYAALLEETLGGLEETLKKALLEETLAPKQMCNPVKSAVLGSSACSTTDECLTAADMPHDSQRTLIPKLDLRLVCATEASDGTCQGTTTISPVFSNCSTADCEQEESICTPPTTPLLSYVAMEGIRNKPGEDSPASCAGTTGTPRFGFCFSSQIITM